MNGSAKTGLVTIGIPVFRGERFIEETLRSIAAQTERRFTAVISLDGPQPEAEALCRPFLDDARFRLVVQPQRLGWVAHLSWLMERVETPFWCYQQQDDLLYPQYLETLIDAAERAPEAAVCYSDIELIGTIAGTITQNSVTGSASARQLALLYEHQPAVAFRGLTRVEALRLAGGVPSNEVDSFGCDTVWMAAAARWGELRRVPGALYRKRYHDANEHMTWFTWPVEKRTSAWLAHCAAMLSQAMRVDATPQERRLLWLAGVARLTSPRAVCGYLPVAAWGAAERDALLETFFEYVAGGGLDVPALLGASWPAIRHWSSAFTAAPMVR